MQWRFVRTPVLVAGIALGLLCTSVTERRAAANGRLPATSTITFRQGHDSDIAVGLTFGLLLSHDGGQTWRWICEAAVGYGGMYDPVYAYTASGALFATTFNGLSVSHDGCTFEPTPEGAAFVSTSALDPNGAFYFAAAQVADPTHSVAQDFNLYRSTNDLATLPTPVRVAAMTDTNVWWQSIAIAPSDPKIVYLSGYHYIPKTGGGTVREGLLFRSTNAGAAGSWTALARTGLTLMPNSVIHIAGIWKDDPTHLYARVEFIDNATTDALYVSTNSGDTWTQILTAPNPLGAFVVRAAKNTGGTHDLVVGTPTAPGAIAMISHDDGAHWQPLDGAPHMNCLVENAAGELWACTQNYGIGQGTMMSDGAGIMKTTDLATWTKVLRYEDLTDAAACGGDTIQAKTCAPTWCGVCAQLMCKPSASYACPSAAPEAPPPRSGGCCETGAGGGEPLALALVVASVVGRRRARRRPERR